jgi:H+/gluconate symporter-like permease
MALFVVDFFNVLTIFPHLVVFRISSVMEETGTLFIFFSISSKLEESFGSTAVALLNAVAYCARSCCARVDDMTSDVLLFTAAARASVCNNVQC